MNTQIERVSNEAAQMVLDWLKQGGELVAEQAPAICQEIVARGIAQHTALIGIFLAAGILCSITAWQCGKWLPHCEEYSDVKTGCQIGLFFASIGAVGCLFIGCGVNAYELLSIYVAPKVYVIETLAASVK